MKKVLSLVLSLVMLCSVQNAFAEGGGISVTLDGEKIEFDQAPILENGRVLVPIRAISEALGCTVVYYEYEGKASVDIIGGLMSVYTVIGSDVMAYYDEAGALSEIKLDVPSKVVGDRTLVPVRALSEIFNADVDWDEDAQTVVITKKSAQHKINSVKLADTECAENGRELVVFEASYPEVKNPENDEFISALNEEYKAYAYECMETAKEWVEDAELILEHSNYGNDTALLPFTYTLDFEVTRDSDDILSIVVLESEYLGGAHPSGARISTSFDMKNKKVLELDDILKGTKEEIAELTLQTFKEKLIIPESYDETFAETVLPAIAEEKENVSYFMTEDGVVLYFSLYQVAPYAAGYPSAKIYYAETTESFCDGIVPHAYTVIGGADSTTSIFVTDDGKASE